jgi:hypothetical protein
LVHERFSFMQSRARQPSRGMLLVGHPRYMAMPQFSAKLSRI